MLTRVRPTVTCKPCKPTCHHEWGRSLRPRQVQRKQSHSASTQWLDGMVYSSPHYGAMPRTNLFQIHHRKQVQWHDVHVLLSFSTCLLSLMCSKKDTCPPLLGQCESMSLECNHESVVATDPTQRHVLNLNLTWHVDVLHVHVLTWVMGQWADRNCQHTALQAEKQKDQKSKPRIAWIWMQMTGLQETLNIVERATSLLLYIIKQCQIAINWY